MCDCKPGKHGQVAVDVLSCGHFVWADPLEEKDTKTDKLLGVMMWMILICLVIAVFATIMDLIDGDSHDLECRKDETSTSSEDSGRGPEVLRCVWSD